MTTEIVAWIGAITGVGNFVWKVFEWRKTGKPFIQVSTNSGMVEFGGLSRSDEKFVVINVRNTGKAATTVTKIAMAHYDSLWKRLRLKQSKAWFVFAKSSQPLPRSFAVGEDWIGCLIQNAEVDVEIKKGTLWCLVYHSFSERPAMARILPKKDPKTK